MGVHIGRYYDAHGRKRAARVDFERNVTAAKAWRAATVARVLAAPRCTVTTTNVEGRRGIWKKMACGHVGPTLHVPRWAVNPDAGKLCVCLPFGKGDDGEPEEQELPHKYRSCDADASECEVRTG